ncbi:cytochrome P450 [Mycolicibacterium porcinum]|nr:cytochrome P450 [Mycolicibacterium porcinum]
MLEFPCAALAACAYFLLGERMVSALVTRYGPVVSLPLLGYGTLVIVSDAAHAKQVFTTSPHSMLGGEGVGPAAAICGTGSMFVQEEPDHLLRRKLLTPAFSGAALLDGYAEVMAAAAREALRGWPPGRPMKMLDFARNLSLNIIVRVVAGPDAAMDNNVLRRLFGQLLELAVSEQIVVRYALRRAGALRRWRRLTAANQAIDGALYPLIARRRRSPAAAGGNDVLAALLSAIDDSAAAVSDREIRDDLVTLMMAGHETTAITLANIIDLLVHHPRILARVTDEAHHGGDAYTSAVINETLRLRPPLPFTARVTAGDCDIGAYTIAAGCRVMVHINGVNHDPAIYPAPQLFQPERFLDRDPPPYAWIPFGGGVKRCLGANFAHRELTVVLHELLRAGTFTSVRNRPDTVVRRSIVLVPRRGAAVTFRPADPADTD